MTDLGTILDDARKDEREFKISDLAHAIKQGMRATAVRLLHPDSWVDKMRDSAGKGRQTWYNRADIVDVFSNLLMTEDGLNPEFASINPTKIVAIVPICREKDEEYKRNWLIEARELSASDLKRAVKEEQGEKVHECTEWEEYTDKRCKVCKKRKKETHGDIG